MTNETMSLTIIFAFIIGATAIGMVPGMREKLTLEHWAIGGRTFGRWLNWFVLVGEMFTAFAFLGASGWAYARGGPTFYMLAYPPLGYLLSYHLLPLISPLGKKYNLLTQPDYVEYRYGSKTLGLIVAFIGVLFMLPYLQLQLTGLGLIIEVCSYGVIPRIPAMLAAFTLVALFVYVSGLKGVATSAILKDIVMFGAVAFFGLYLPVHYFGSIGGLFEAINTAKPGFLAMPGGTKNLDAGWYITTVLLTCAGVYMWPHIFANSYSAKDARVLRHNAQFLPFYALCMLFPMLAGFTALLVITPALSTPDMAFMVLVQKVFPGWALGLVGGAGALACMIPAADLLLGSSMLVTHNLYGRTVGKDSDPETIGRLARLVVVGLTGLALLLAVYLPNMLVNLLLTGYAGITQFFPLIVGGLLWRRASKLGAVAGLLVGECLVFWLILNKLDPLPVAGTYLNAGFVALVVNSIIFAAVSLLSNTSATADKTVEAECLGKV